MGGIARTCPSQQDALQDPLRNYLHDIVVVSGEDGDTRPRLPIPDPDRLIVRRRDDPRVFSVEEHRSDIVEIFIRSPSARPFPCCIRLTAGQGEEAFPLFVVPHLDLVVVPSRAKDGLSGVEADAPDRTYCHTISPPSTTAQ